MHKRLRGKSPITSFAIYTLIRESMNCSTASKIYNIRIEADVVPEFGNTVPIIIIIPVSVPNYFIY